MKLKTSLPIIATGVISLVATGQVSASSCSDKALHAEKLTLQAERYQKRAAELKSGEHDNQIRGMKRRANNMRAKALKLKKACAAKPKPATVHHVKAHNDDHGHHSHFHY